MGLFVDITGKKYGMLTAISPTEARSSSGSVFWRFRCDCGNEKIVLGQTAISGRVVSCGCYHAKVAGEQGRKKRTHGQEPQRLYNSWMGMMSRCYNPNSEKYARYGGRGIAVCEEWRKNFEPFRDWSFINGYSANLTIDRINCDGNYEPGNCRWTDQKTQQRNRSTNRRFEINGEILCLSEISERTGVNYNTLKTRLSHGLCIEDAMVP